MWSLVASIELNDMLVTLFDQYNDESYDFASVHIAVHLIGCCRTLENMKLLKCPRTCCVCFVVIEPNVGWTCSYTSAVYIILKKKKIRTQFFWRWKGNQTFFSWPSHCVWSKLFVNFVDKYTYNQVNTLVHEVFLTLISYNGESTGPLTENCTCTILYSL